jgi:hypothetical protein
LENRFGGSRPQAAALVLDLDRYAIVVYAASEPYMAGRSRELERILEKIGDRRCKKMPVDIDE